MAKRNRNLTEDMIAKRIKEGRGLGEGAEYKPWIYIRDITSQGVSGEIYGWKTGRTHQVLSNNERDYLNVLEWSRIITDIREQYPLLDENRTYNETVQIAESLGIKYAIVPYTGTYSVLTTDFLITAYKDGQKQIFARTVKQTKDLANERVIEKLDIERLYWKNRGIDWKIVTEKEINHVLAQNVSFLHSYKAISCLSLDVSMVGYIEAALINELRNNCTIVSHAAQKVDSLLCLSPGKTLSVIRYLLANRYWFTDMNRKINFASINTRIFQSQSSIGGLL
jgi:hypothetical protein